MSESRIDKLVFDKLVFKLNNGSRHLSWRCASDLLAANRTGISFAMKGWMVALKVLQAEGGEGGNDSKAEMESPLAGIVPGA